jgi:hypothetical protein
MLRIEKLFDPLKPNPGSPEATSTEKQGTSLLTYYNGYLTHLSVEWGECRVILIIQVELEQLNPARRSLIYYLLYTTTYHQYYYSEL